MKPNEDWSVGDVIIISNLKDRMTNIGVITAVTNTQYFVFFTKSGNTFDFLKVQSTRERWRELFVDQKHIKISFLRNENGDVDDGYTKDK